MNVDIIVIRQPGDKQGEDIEDRLICTVNVALERGRNEFDENSGLQSISLSSVLRPSLMPGMLVEVQDSLQGASWRGKITTVAHAISSLDSGAEAITNLTIKRAT